MGDRAYIVDGQLKRFDLGQILMDLYFRISNSNRLLLCRHGSQSLRSKRLNAKEQCPLLPAQLDSNTKLI
jgi:hypothetical protein